MSTTHDVAISPALLTKAQAEVYVGSPTVFSDLCARHQIRPLYRGVGKVDVVSSNLITRSNENGGSSDRAKGRVAIAGSNPRVDRAAAWLEAHGLCPLSATHFGHELARAAEILTPADEWPDERDWPGPVGVLARVIDGYVRLHEKAFRIMEGREGE